MAYNFGKHNNQFKRQTYLTLTPRVITIICSFFWHFNVILTVLMSSFSFFFFSKSTMFFFGFSFAVAVFYTRYDLC